jgi:hypothetical protein
VALVEITLAALFLGVSALSRLGAAFTVFYRLADRWVTNDDNLLKLNGDILKVPLN